MKIETLIISIFLMFSTFAFGQTKKVEINGILFSFKQIKLDTLESAENEIVELYRNGKKLLTHTMFKEEGDCSSTHIQLGKYKVDKNKIKFYTYWAATERMPGLILPFGFREQIYTVDSLGILKLSESKIYIENIVSSENKIFLEENGWKHKGLKYLNKVTKSKYEKRLLDDYIKNVEKEYNSKFVLNDNRDELEKKVRSIMEKEIEKYTGNWIEGEAFGRVKK